jgi:sulfide:quinone oxidoreductase
MTAEYFAMRVLEVAPDVFVSGQLFEHEIRAAAKQGVKTIVNNRPDGEAPGQPPSRDLQRVAEELGMTYVYFPVISGRLTPEDVKGFRKLSDEFERPALIFCRTGARSMMLWQLAEGAE